MRLKKNAACPQCRSRRRNKGNAERQVKQTGAHWQNANAVRMAYLGSLEYANEWDDYWNPQKSAASPTLAA